ncbi:hypothetical protein T261_04660 [Streptomyces lydicus]|nr:hypothetical protein T261_04660 [Streptomyces lydicus]
MTVRPGDRLRSCISSGLWTKPFPGCVMDTVVSGSTSRGEPL